MSRRSVIRVDYVLGDLLKRLSAARGEDEGRREGGRGEIVFYSEKRSARDGRTMDDATLTPTILRTILLCRSVSTYLPIVPSTQYPPTSRVIQKIAYLSIYLYL